MTNPLDDSLQYLKGVGPARAADFANLHIHTVRELLFTFPRNLSDRSNITAIVDAPIGEEVSFLVQPIDVRDKKVRGGKMRITTVQFADETGTLEATWFNSPWVKDAFTGDYVLLFGKTKFEYGTVKVDHPKFEAVPDTNPGDALHIGRIVPIYPCTGKLNQTVWRKVMKLALDTRLEHLEELHSADFCQARDFPDRQTAVRNMHFPEDDAAHQRAYARLVYDECLLMQMAICLSRRHLREDLPGRQFAVSATLDSRIRHLFPFRLTAAQDRTVHEIIADMKSPLPMHRLLQGDVGSGKTVVALYAMLVAVTHKTQVCIMAPTGLLARQHLNTINAFLARSKNSSVHVSLLAAGLPAPERKDILTRLAVGAIDILIATHSAFQKKVVFKDLGLVVIDEQHKFGVRQRAALTQKGYCPDTLVMTATPIPRSLALTIYGDLDVSVIDELPPGRKPVKTSIPSLAREQDVWRFVRRELNRGQQAYVVCPLVEDSEDGKLISVKQAFAELAKGALSGCQLALMHGKLKREEQAEIMARFNTGEIQVLVSTIVIEVGVDVPNANVMVVLNAERFGLAQLHQLRGRIGRGAEAGHFILLTQARGEESQRRLAVLQKTQDGFTIAEEDLLMRGPGEFFGTKQHGLPELKLVDIVRDLSIIRGARRDADKLLAADPKLRQPEHRVILMELRQMLGERWAEAGIG